MGITQGFYNLHIVDIRSCPEMKHVTWLILAPNLKKMRIYFCPNMKEIINSEKLGEVPVEMVQNLNPFARLEHLELEELQMTVKKCPEFKKLPLDRNSRVERKSIIKGEESWWKELEWDNQVSQS
ncbi:hypothetical protein KPL70_008077 [Citrus sinensis]|nr:hypothetical protein KPL70_008077 [Citrus sinensis]